MVRVQVAVGAFASGERSVRGVSVHGATPGPGSAPPGADRTEGSRERAAGARGIRVRDARPCARNPIVATDRPRARCPRTMRLQPMLLTMLFATCVLCVAHETCATERSSPPRFRWWTHRWSKTDGFSAQTYNATTRVKKHSSERVTYSIRNSLGQHWTEDEYAGGYDIWWKRWRFVRDLIVREEVVWVGDEPVPCRVRLRESSGGPPCGVDPVSSWVNRQWDWIPLDSTRGGVVMRKYGGETNYRGGRVVASPDTATHRLLAFRELVEVGGRAIPCRKWIAEPVTFHGAELGRLVWWQSADVPGGVVREVFESGRPGTRSHVHHEKLLVDFAVW